MTPLPEEDKTGLGLFGKHPAFGDFIGAGVPAALQAAFEAWLSPALARISAGRGGDFAALYDQAAVIGFWIGAEVMAESARLPLRGVVVGARDRVGRRFPLVLVQYPAGPQPPPLAAEDGFHATASAGVVALLSQEAVSVGDLLALLPALPRPQAASADESSLFWAANPDHPAAAVWHGLAAADLHRAARGRSYWWTDLRPGFSASAVLACDGLPGPGALEWLMAGVALPPPAAPPEEVADEAPDAPPSEVMAADVAPAGEAAGETTVETAPDTDLWEAGLTDDGGDAPASEDDDRAPPAPARTDHRSRDMSDAD